MNDKRALPDSQKKQPPLMRKFVIFSAMLFLVILVAGSMVFVFSIRQIIGENKGIELSKVLEFKRLKLETSVNNEISTVLMMKNSPLIKNYFANPDNAQLHEMAFKEIAAYRNAFAAKSIFWVNDVDKIFYFNDEKPYFLDPDLPVNYWYRMTLYETEVYNFNINYNPNLNVTNLWINAPVFDERGRPLGMLGTGIDLSAFLDVSYRDSTGRADFYFFNAAGEITGAKDVGLVAAKKNIEEKIRVAGAGIIANAKNLKPDEVLILDSSMGKIAIGVVPLLGWYSVAMLPDSLADYNNVVSLLFFVMLIVIAMVLIIFNIFIAGLLKPLRKSMLDAEAANIAKSNFLSTMSHEMRTPMNAIIGMVTIGKNSEDISRKDYAFDKIEHASRHLLGVINDVLDMSKIEANKIELASVEFDFESMIQRVITVINSRMEEKRQEFSLNIDCNIPKFIIGDDQRLAQVILNLLSNAVKFTPEAGKISLDVSVLEERNGVCELRFEVADNGVGIAPEGQKKLFDKFVQAESGTSREYGGTGLGLAISKSIIELMNGRIWVESAPGKGARFVFTINAVRGQRQLARIHENVCMEGEQDGVSSAVGEFAGKRLLLAEDVEINREIIISLLEGTGLIIDSVENGKEALAAIKADCTSYDIVFMDLQMPKMDGLEATRRIRALPALQDRKLPIIAMTANVFKNDIEECLAAGMDDHLGKPINIVAIIETLRKYL